MGERVTAREIIQEIIKNMYESVSHFFTLLWFQADTTFICTLTTMSN